MNLRQIEIFHAVFLHGTVSAAARSLNVSQPSVTKVLRHTERTIGLPLFERTKGRLIPTQDARNLAVAEKPDWIFCLVRTDFTKKHEGISFVLFDMTTPGVETRPILLISGSSPFCETFFTDVKVPAENLLGEDIRPPKQGTTGGWLETGKLDERTEQRLRNLGFFEGVDIQTVPGSAPDKTVVKVKVAEQSTGELTFGAGFSTADGPLGNIGVRERNLLGRGQDLTANFTLSQRRQLIQLSFTEPYFLDRDLAAGFDLFRSTTDFKSQSSFDETSTGGTLRAALAVFGEDAAIEVAELVPEVVDE